jgi:hypothetical protein
MADEWWGRQKGLRQTLRTEVAVGREAPDTQLDQWAITIRYEDESPNDNGSVQMFLATGPLLVPRRCCSRDRCNDFNPGRRGSGAYRLDRSLFRLGEATTRPVKKPLQRRSSGPLTGSRSAMKTNPVSSDTPDKTPVVLIRARSCLQRVWSEFPHVTFNQGNVGPGLRHVDEEVLIFLVLALRGPAGAFPSVLPILA